MQQIVHKRADRAVKMRFLTAAVAVRAEQFGAAIAALPLGKMPVLQIFAFGPAINGLERRFY